MSALNDNPFAVLTAVVAPAVLTNACSVLCLGTSNRIARVVDRTRVITASLAPTEKEGPRYQLQTRQLERLQVRAKLLFTALRILYTSLGSFAAAALLSVLGAILASLDQQVAFRATAAIGLATGALGVACLVGGCWLMVREVRLALQNMADEANLTRNTVDRLPTI